jgi:hypothetical protein
MNLTFPSFPARFGEEIMLCRSMLPDESRFRLDYASDGARTTALGSYFKIYSATSRLELLTWCK